MSFIHDIQKAAISQETDVPTLLRMCKLLAARISNEPFAKWVDAELNGYTDIASLPEYRKAHVESYGTFHGGFTHASKLQIPISILPERLRDHYQHAYMMSGISAYSSLAEGEKTGACLERWPMEIAVEYASKATPDMQCIGAWKEIPVGAIVRLLDSVKTRVLGFAIELEREAPDAGESPIGGNPVSQDRVTQIFNTQITGNVGNVSNAGSNFSQQAISAVHAGDWESLRTFLTSLGVPEHELAGLKNDLEGVAAKPDVDAVERKQVAEAWTERIKRQLGNVGTAVAAEGVIAAIKLAIATYLG